MTTRQALKKAQGKWGKNAAVRWRKGTPDQAARSLLPKGDPGKFQYRAEVGRVMMGMFFEVLGQGDTFEEAFEKAEAHERADRERYAKLRQS